MKTGCGWELERYLGNEKGWEDSTWEHGSQKRRDSVGPALLWRVHYLAGCTSREVDSFLAISPTLISPLTISASK